MFDDIDRIGKIAIAIRVERKVHGRNREMPLQDVLTALHKGEGQPGKTLFGTVAEKVVRKAKCAVLVVPLSYARGRAATQP
jgi:hypothetical protein